MFKTIVVGTDGSPSADDAVQKAGELAALCGATLHVITAYRPVNEIMVHPEFAALPIDVQSMLKPDEDARTVADTAAAGLRARGVDARPHTKAGHPADVLVDAAEALSADLVVVGSRGMTGARRVLGSVPNSVSHHAPCTVMIVSTC